MDQVQLFLKKLKKHHFWLVCALATVAGVTVCYMAVGRLVEEKSGYESNVTQSFSSMDNLVRAQNHANPEYHDNQAQLNDEAAQAIGQAWEKRFRKQVGLLTWPDTLPDSWTRKVEDLRPIEQHVEWTGRDNSTILDKFDRQTYEVFIQGQLPRLAETIGARWRIDEASGDALGEGETPPVVIWDQANQTSIVQEHFNWSNLRPDPVPTTLHVLYAQEDLWVFEALMQIIAKTNGENAVAHKAVIREIHNISIGKSAGEPWGSIFEPEGSNTPGGEAAEERPAPGPQTFAGVGAILAGEAPPAQASTAQNDPGEGRYVDRDYQPLTAAQLRSSISSQSPQDAYLAVAKRMPVRMQLTMDQRRITRLLVECANSPLTVEVRQVHVTAQHFEGDPGTQRDEGRVGNYPLTGGAHDPALHGAGAAEMESRGGTQRVYDAEVEIYGIIYIYNDVNWEKLEIDPEDLQLQGYTSTGAPDEAP